MECHDVFLIKVHQCQHGLRFPDSELGDFCKKDTWFLTNDSRFISLSRLCDGRHMHVHPIGDIRTSAGWVQKNETCWPLSGTPL